jgi:hypothetical protein
MHDGATLPGICSPELLQHRFVQNLRRSFERWENSTIRKVLPEGGVRRRCHTLQGTLQKKRACFNASVRLVQGNRVKNCVTKGCGAESVVIL